MLQTLVLQLQTAFRKIRLYTHTKERNTAIAEGEAIVEKISAALLKKPVQDSQLRFAAAKLLASLGTGTMFPGARNFIRRQAEFDTAVNELRNIVGEVEDITL